MCGCGGARTSVEQSPARTEVRGQEAESTVRFTYVGRTRLAIVGSATRTLYRFEGSGATLTVDRRDAYGLSALPALRREP